MVSDLISGFDEASREVFSDVLGWSLNDKDWEQCLWKVKEGGLGVRDAGTIADAAYFSSRLKTYESCRALDAEHRLEHQAEDDEDEMQVDRIGDDNGCAGEGCLAQARDRIKAQLPGNVFMDARKQGAIVEKIAGKKRDERMQDASGVEEARLKVMAAPHAGDWLHAPPSKELEYRFTNEEFRSRTGRRLGKELCDETRCPLCFQVLDRFGIHAETCMAGGDKTLAHNEHRNTLFKQAKLGGLQPELEKGGLFQEAGGREQEGDERDARRRPADVLLCRAQDFKTRGGE